DNDKYFARDDTGMVCIIQPDEAFGPFALSAAGVLARCARAPRLARASPTHRTDVARLRDGRLVLSATRIANGDGSLRAPQCGRSLSSALQQMPRSRSGSG